MILADKENTKMEEEKEVDTREAEGGKYAGRKDCV